MRKDTNKSHIRNISNIEEFKGFAFEKTEKESPYIISYSTTDAKGESIELCFQTVMVMENVNIYPREIIGSELIVAGDTYEYELTPVLNDASVLYKWTLYDPEGEMCFLSSGPTVQISLSETSMRGEYRLEAQTLKKQETNEGTVKVAIGNLLVKKLVMDGKNVSSSVASGGVMVHPNPAKKMITISGAEGLRRVTVFSMEGSVILVTDKDNISVADLIDSEYILKIETDGGVVVRKVVVRK